MFIRVKMDDTNGHNPFLVEKINTIFSTEAHYLKARHILLALIKRDMDEFERTLNWKPSLYVDKLSIDNFMEYCGSNYLQHVADDADLQLIIDFVRLK